MVWISGSTRVVGLGVHAAAVHSHLVLQIDSGSFQPSPACTTNWGRGHCAQIRAVDRPLRGSSSNTTIRNFVSMQATSLKVHLDCICQGS